MRLLPQSPSIDFLKQQAKDLLVALREMTPAATLADAQQSLAEQHGFNCWTALRNEVERRRAEAGDADPILAREIADRFELGAVSRATVVAHELMGPVLRIETGRVSWRARGVFDWMDEPQTADAIRLMQAANEAGFRTETPVRSAQENWVETIADQPWRVDVWSDRGPPLALPVSAADAGQAGAILGALHKLAVPTSRPINRWLTERRTPAQWRALAGYAASKSAPWTGEFEAVLPKFFDLSATANDADAETPILCACNVAPASVRVGPSRAFVLDCWEFAGALPPRWELGSALHAWSETPGGALNPATARPLIEAYAVEMGARPPLDISIFVAAISAWLNWLASRVFAALEEGDAPSQATAELRAMLARPLSRDALKQLLQAAS